MAPLSLTLLGGFHIRSGDGQALNLPTKKAWALLAYLAIRPGQAQPRDKLASLLWGDTGEAQARDSLRHTLAVLRKAMPAAKPAPLVAEGQTLALNPAAVEVDVAAFELAVAQGTPEALEQAAGLYQGDLLEGLNLNEPLFEDWLLAERERLRELALEALAKLLAHQSKAGSIERAIQTAGRLLALDPLQEVVHRTLMRLYSGQGRRGAALKQYQACVGVLQRELGAESEPETRRLYQEILQRRSPEAGKQGVVPGSQAREHVSPGPRPDILTQEMPLVGRGAELARLRQALDDAGRGRAQVVLVVGEAGIGKSRMINELVTTALQRGIQVLLGRCYESERILPFGPWVDALRSGRVLSDGRLLEGLNPVWRTELARLFPELGEPGLDLSTAPENSVRLFEAVVQLVGQLVAGKPLLLILEDLHWADELSLRLLSFLARRADSWPLLLAGTEREEEVADAPGLRALHQELDREHRLVRVPLLPLSRAETLVLVRALARTGLAESRVASLGEQVWALSEGNPFVVAETMHAVREERAGEAASGLSLPQRAREVVIGRLERLSPPSQGLVEVAAVIGRELDFALLQRAAGIDDREVAEGLEELVRRRVLTLAGEQLEFAHHRIQQVAYERVLPARRRSLHADVGRALETLYAGRLEEVYDRLAHHYARAENADKAVTYLGRFAERAAGEFAHAQAVSALQEAIGRLEALPSDRERDRRLLQVILRQAHSLYFLGRFRETLDLLLQHREHLERLDDPSVAGVFHFWLGHTYSYLGDQARAAESAKQAIEEATRCGDTATVGKAHYVLSREGPASGQLLEGAHHGLQAVSVFEKTEERWWLGQSHWIVGMNCMLSGDFERALEAADRALAIGEAIRDLRLQSYAGWTAGWTHAIRGEWEEGISACQRGLAIAPDPFTTAAARGFLGHAHLEKGDHAQAIVLLEPSVRDLGSFRFAMLHGWFTTYLGEAYLLAGDLDRARASMLQGLDITTRIHFAYGIAWTRRALGRLAQARGELSEAQDHLRDAVERFRQVHARFEVGRTLLDLAALARSRGSGEAATWRDEAREIFEAVRTPRYIERTLPR